MKESNFKFLNPVVTKLNFEVNNNYQNDGNNIGIGNDFSVKISRSKQDNEAVVELQINIGSMEKTLNSPFFIEMIIISKFSWDNVYDEKTINDLLTINAPALLLGYARPIISTITNISPYPTYNIPFYNFTEN